jgi:hypothetical protein
MTDRARPQRLHWQSRQGRLAGHVLYVSGRSLFRNVCRVRRPDGSWDERLDEYKKWLMADEQAALRRLARQLLAGRDLACGCKPGAPCHADVLLKLVADG